MGKRGRRSPRCFAVRPPCCKGKVGGCPAARGTSSSGSASQNLSHPPLARFNRAINTRRHRFEAATRTRAGLADVPGPAARTRAALGRLQRGSHLLFSQKLSSKRAEKRPPGSYFRRGLFWRDALWHRSAPRSHGSRAEGAWEGAFVYLLYAVDCGARRAGDAPPPTPMLFIAVLDGSKLRKLQRGI